MKTDTDKTLAKTSRVRAAAETGRGTRGLRMIRFAGHLGVGLLLAGLLFPLLGERRRQTVLRCWSRRALSVLGVRLELSGTVPDSADAAGWMLLPNHISWLDILVLNATCPVRFVAKAEVSGWPLLGLLARRAGTLFIHREKRRDTGRINADIAHLLEQGGKVAVFAEGTTSDGSAVRPFHSSLLAPAVTSGTRVYPVAIRYCTPDGQREPAPAYIDAITMGISLAALLRRPMVRAVVAFDAPLPTAGLDRRALARQAHAAVVRLLTDPAPGA